MKKGADDVRRLEDEAAALLNLGNYDAALAKFRTALAASQTNRDDVNAIGIHLLMINCHVALEEVS